LKKLLYVTASPKPETESTSKQAGRAFTGRFITDNPDYTLEELDLPTADIPEPSHRYFTGRVELVSGAEYDILSEQDKHAVDRINELCTQFQSADAYVIASPMWSLSFPSRLKQYLDCIMLNNRLIRLTDTGVEGLLCDKPRKMVYIQSSGGIYPKIFYSQLNYGVKYFHDIFKYLGIKEFHKILIQGTDMASVGKEKALSCASEDFECVLKKMTCADSKIPISV
jgi:FMN-dependent NADH-azoreductase